MDLRPARVARVRSRQLRAVRPLRIAVVHSYYRSDQPSGENALVDAQVEALRRNGHDVVLVAADSDQATSWSRLGPVRAAARVATGAGRGVRGRLPDGWEPDVVHVHNTFPNLGRRWVVDAPWPVVATLHNYRPLCAAATLFRDGAGCTECLDSGRHRGLVHGCYRGSRLATVPLTLGQRGADDPVLRGATLLTALSDVQAAFYLAAGVPAERLRVLPNFIPDSLAPAAGSGGEAWLYAGRLTSEKGVVDTVRTWPDDVPLVVVGSGPAEDDVRAAARGKSVVLRGAVDRAEVVELLRTSRGLVFPSAWPDPFGLVYAEALAAGTPVLATPPSAAAGLVAEDGAGRATERIDASVVREAHAAFPGLRTAARRAFEARYTEPAHVNALVDVYAEAVLRAAVARSR
jgi:glycosyltransferase involved in cell wall biosynthesis